MAIFSRKATVVFFLIYAFLFKVGQLFKKRLLSPFRKGKVVQRSKQEVSFNRCRKEPISVPIQPNSLRTRDENS